MTRFVFAGGGRIHDLVTRSGFARAGEAGTPPSERYFQIKLKNESSECRRVTMLWRCGRSFVSSSGKSLSAAKRAPDLFTDLAKNRSSLWQD
jgi:hypothetical protein